MNLLFLGVDMKHKWLARGIATMLVLAAGVVQAQGRLERIKAEGQITLGYRDSSIPFSYLDDAQKPVGYSMDICERVVEAVRTHLGLPELRTKLVSVTSSTRIPLVANGTVDMSCGSATNNAQRQRQVSFAPTTFVTAMRFASLKRMDIKGLDDLKGKTVVSTSGTSNLQWLTQVNAEQKLGMRIIPAKDHAAGFLTVESGRAAAFFMDDVLLVGLVAASRDPQAWQISEDEYSLEPYAIILAKGDEAFKKVVDDAIKDMMQDGTMVQLYEKWFTQPIPPKNINLNWPLSERLKRAFAHPTDSPEPDVYK